MNGEQVEGGVGTGKETRQGRGGVNGDARIHRHSEVPDIPPPPPPPPPPPTQPQGPKALRRARKEHEEWGERMGGEGGGGASRGGGPRRKIPGLFTLHRSRSTDHTSRDIMGAMARSELGGPRSWSHIEQVWFSMTTLRPRPPPWRGERAVRARGALCFGNKEAFQW